MVKKRGMREKLLSIALSVMIVFAFMPWMGSFAYADEITYTNTTADHKGTADVGGFSNDYGPIISSDKATYELGDNIYIKVENAAVATSGGWIGIYKDLNANKDTTTECWAYTGNGTVADVTDYVMYGPDKNSGVTVNSELSAGTYYIILMALNGK